MEDAKFLGSEYEVVYTDRTEVEFDLRFNIIDIAAYGLGRVKENYSYLHGSKL